MPQAAAWPFWPRQSRREAAFTQKRDGGKEAERVDKCPLKSRLEDQTLFMSAYFSCLTYIWEKTKLCIVSDYQSVQVSLWLSHHTQHVSGCFTLFNFSDTSCASSAFLISFCQEGLRNLREQPTKTLEFIPHFFGSTEKKNVCLEALINCLPGLKRAGWTSWSS